MKEINPRYTVPSRNHILERYILPMYNESKHDLKLKISRCPSQGVTTDAWSSKSMDSFITYTISMYNPVNKSMECYVLDTLEVTGSHTGQKLAEDLQLSIADWGLKNVIGISDNAENIQSAFRIAGIPHFGCGPHTLQLGLNKGLEDPAVKKLAGKVRALVSKFRKSYLKTQELRENQKLLGLKVYLTFY